MLNEIKAENSYNSNDHQNFNTQELNMPNEQQELKSQDTDVQEIFSNPVATHPLESDPLIKRAGHCYQILAAAIVRAQTSKQEIQGRINEAATQIQEYQQALHNINELLEIEHIDIIDKESAQTHLSATQSILRDKYSNQLTNQVESLKNLSMSEMSISISEIRSKLDVIEKYIKKINILNNLVNSYLSHQQFQSFRQRADIEFKALLSQY